MKDPALNCEEAENYIGRNLDGDLSREEIQSLYLHIGTCSGCQKRMVEITRLDRSLKNLHSHFERYTPREGFESRVLAAIEASHVQPELKEGRPVVLTFLTELVKDKECLDSLNQMSHDEFIQVMKKKTGVIVPFSRLKQMLLDITTEGRAASGSGELSDEALAKVAGGVSDPEFTELLNAGNMLLELFDQKGWM